MPAAAPRRALPELVDLGDAPSGRRHLVAVPPLPDPDEEIPDPNPDFVRALAVQGFEAIEGTRSISQLGPLISVGLARELALQRAARSDRRVVCRDGRRNVPRAIGLRIDRNQDEVAEAAVVLRIGAVACAVAIRLEWAHRHWRASVLTVL